MTDLSEIKKLASYRPTHKVRFVTAASLFDGHDASINIMRRILQAMGAEVIHLGHNRSVEEIVTAALQEDVQGVAVSSYQGGHVEFFKYMIDLLRERGGANIKVYGGGGGVIVPAEIKELHEYGVARIFSPEDGQKMGLQGMIGSMVAACDVDLSPLAPKSIDALREKDVDFEVVLPEAIGSGQTPERFVRAQSRCSSRASLPLTPQAGTPTAIIGMRPATPLRTKTKLVDTTPSGCRASWVLLRVQCCPRPYRPENALSRKKCERAFSGR